MQQTYIIEKTIPETGILTLESLPFDPGDVVEMIIRVCDKKKKTRDNKLFLEISSTIEPEILRQFIDYAEGKSILQHSKATEKDIEALADEITSDWWNENKKRFSEQ